MFSTIRKRLTYANVAMTLALVFAMTGGAYAASKYVITSTKQISPKVLKALKGANGKNGTAGPAGPAGAAGAGTAGAQGSAGAAGAKGETGATGAKGEEGKAGKNGAPGAPGEPWTAGGTLPSEKTETGTWSFAGGPEGSVFTSISFTLPLTKALGAAEVNYVEATGNGTTCPGSLASPSATAGNLCVYQGYTAGVTGEHHVVPTYKGYLLEILKSEPVLEGAGTSGAILIFARHETEIPIVEGTWAVTAP